MMERRKALDGSIPKRTTVARRPLELPADGPFAEMRAGSNGQEVSTTMAFTRLLRGLARDEHIGPRVVPIIPDEARTFGMDALFRELNIYASQGQKYQPVDHDLLLSYSESAKGQILEEGITEAGSMASFIAAGTSYSTRGVPMVPFYTFYSMFGFQRVGDLIWQAADMRTRGFLMAATAGRTTLLGEGLQHQDGHSLVLASTVPFVQAYDPAFAYEVGAIVQPGMNRMFGGGPPEVTDVFYYITLYNENYEMPPLPDTPGLAEAIVEGLYKWADAPAGPSKRATILFSGTAHTAAREAAAELAEHYDVAAELWSATSYKSLREEALAAERSNRLHPSKRTARASGDPDPRRVAGADHRGVRLHEDGAGAGPALHTRTARSCHWAPTGWDDPTLARPCGDTSRSTRATWCWPSSTVCSPTARSTSRSSPMPSLATTSTPKRPTPTSPDRQRRQLGSDPCCPVPRRRRSRVPLSGGGPSLPTARYRTRPQRSGR